MKVLLYAVFKVRVTLTPQPTNHSIHRRRNDLEPRAAPSKLNSAVPTNDANADRLAGDPRNEGRATEAENTSDSRSHPNLSLKWPAEP
jgi:hypothetical protein